MEVCAAALNAKILEQFPITENKRIQNTKRNTRHNKMPQIPC